MAAAARGAPSPGASGDAPHGPAPLHEAGRLVLAEPLLTEAVASLAAARTESDVAAACLPLLLGVDAVRAAAVVQRSGHAAVVLASAGYPCGSMSPGTDLPLDAGLPVTEAVRTGRAVVRGPGPGWVALPFGGGLTSPGALLLSLTGPPPEPSSLSRLDRLARALGDALQRAAGQERDAAALGALVDALRTAAVLPPAGAPPVEYAVRSLPLSGEAGGDVLAVLPAADGGTWLLAADVCGSGVPAALVAARVRTAVRACASSSVGPAALLAQVEAALADDVGTGCFVTAAAVLVAPDGRSARTASAGHPPPLVLGDGTPRVVRLEPGPPLALEGQVLPALVEAATRLGEGVVLLLHTDGLTERRVGTSVTLLDPATLVAGADDDLERSADAVLAAAAAVGPAHDDVSLLLARPGWR